jgi:hypothetical protein
MNIGFVNISIYDSVRYNLFYDKNTNLAYFIYTNKKYNIKLNNEYIKKIKENKKIWITINEKKIEVIN